MPDDEPIVGILVTVHLQQERAFVEEDLRQVDPDRLEPVAASRQSRIVGPVRPHQLGPHAAGKEDDGSLIRGEPVGGVTVEKGADRTVHLQDLLGRKTIRVCHELAFPLFAAACSGIGWPSSPVFRARALHLLLLRGRPLGRSRRDNPRIGGVRAGWSSFGGADAAGASKRGSRSRRLLRGACRPYVHAGSRASLPTAIDWTGRPLWQIITTVSLCLGAEKRMSRLSRSTRHAGTAGTGRLDRWSKRLDDSPASRGELDPEPDRVAFQRRMASASAGVSGRSRNDRTRPRMVANRVCASSLPG